MPIKFFEPLFAWVPESPILLEILGSAILSHFSYFFRESLDLSLLRQAGVLLKWHEVLALSAIVFAISEFMERDRLRTHIFKIGALSHWVYGLICISVCAVFASNFFALIDERKHPLLFVNYPAIFEVIALLTLTILMFIVIAFSLFPGIFTPRITRSNCAVLIIKLRNAILKDESYENLAAIAFIINKNFDKVCRYAAFYDRHWNIQGSKVKSPYERAKVRPRDKKLVDYSRYLLNEVMSEPAFAKFLARRNLGMGLKIISSVQKYDLWNSCGDIFFNSYVTELFNEKDSHLSRELEFRGRGIRQPLFKRLFSSLELLEFYRCFQAIPLWRDTAEEYVVRKYTEGLRFALREYYREERSVYMASSASTAISVALENLARLLSSIATGLRKYRPGNDEIWDNQYEDAIGEIRNFFGRGYMDLGQCLMGNDRFKPVFSKEELSLHENSVLHGVRDAIFAYLDGLATMENDEYARYLATAVFWVIYPIKEQPPQIKNLENGLLELIKQRVADNRNGFYSPMIRLLINIYGFGFSSGLEEHIKIGKFVEEEFRATLGEEILADPKKNYLPSSYVVNDARTEIRNSNGTVIYTKPHRVGY